MKKTMIAMAMLATVSLSAGAQEQRQRMSDEEMASRRAEMVQKQAEKLAKDLDLKDDAKTQFIATYSEYQEALMNARMSGRDENRENASEERGEKKSKEMTDEEATQRIEESFARQEAQIAQSQKALEVSREYYAKFKETLTPQQLFKVFGQQQRRGGDNRQGGQGGPQGGPMGGGPRGGGEGFGGGDF